MSTQTAPVVIVGAGPIGLITALGLAHHGIPVIVLEEHAELSLDTKAGTILTRTLEVLHRYGALDAVLRESLRIDEIGDIDRATNVARESVRTGTLTEDTRFPFIINIPQHELEPVLREALEKAAPGALRMSHRVESFEQDAGGVTLHTTTPDGPQEFRADYLLACDGGRSVVREGLGIPVEGKTLDERYMLVDLKVDLDLDNPRDYPYLAYFGDPTEWMILVRQPHCWRFLFPLAAGRPVPDQEELAGKARRFIGEVDAMEIIGSNVYTVHQRVAERFREGRTFLMGDAAHLITPMWALGLNTGVLDASNLPWRLAWVLRGWADEALLDGYEREQAPVAVRGSGQMAEAARAYMDRRGDEGAERLSTVGGWGNAFTRSLLGVSLDVDGTDDWSMIKEGDTPAAVAVGDRAPDLPLFGHAGTVHVHELVSDSFVAFYFADARRHPAVPIDDEPGLKRFVVSRWDAPLDSGLRERSLFDPAQRVQRRFGVEDGTVVLVRPDGHVAAIVPLEPGGEDLAGTIYTHITKQAQGVLPTEGTAA
jgi:3-(3-hydroxy-phenyl)propionate hydroxylase